MDDLTGEARLEAEMAQRARAGLEARIFLRDDDAVSDTAALQRLFALCGEYDAPLLLACIPEPADQGLGRAVRSMPLVTGAVHGFAHANHAPAGEKPCELGLHRGMDKVLEELSRGRTKLEDLFEGELSDILVPPWNRIHDEVASRAGEAGYGGISAHGWQERPAAAPAIFVNVHVDVVHWSADRVGREADWAFGEMANALAFSRGKGNAAVGILAHHLAHDEKAWATLETLLKRLAGLGCRFVSADGELERRLPSQA